MAQMAPRPANSVEPESSSCGAVKPASAFGCNCLRKSGQRWVAMPGVQSRVALVAVLAAARAAGGRGGSAGREFARRAGGGVAGEGREHTLDRSGLALGADLGGVGFLHAPQLLKRSATTGTAVFVKRHRYIQCIRPPRGYARPRSRGRVSPGPGSGRWTHRPEWSRRRRTPLLCRGCLAA